jgi:hypothetical protein
MTATVIAAVIIIVMMILTELRGPATAIYACIHAYTCCACQLHYTRVWVEFRVSTGC